MNIELTNEELDLLRGIVAIGMGGFPPLKIERTGTQFKIAKTLEEKGLVKFLDDEFRLRVVATDAGFWIWENPQAVVSLNGMNTVCVRL